MKIWMTIFALAKIKRKSKQAPFFELLETGKKTLIDSWSGDNFCSTNKSPNQEVILKIYKVSNGYRLPGYLASSLLRKELQGTNRVTVASFKMAIRFRISETTEIDGPGLRRLEPSIKAQADCVRRH